MVDSTDCSSACRYSMGLTSPCLHLSGSTSPCGSLMKLSCPCGFLGRSSGSPEAALRCLKISWLSQRCASPCGAENSSLYALLWGLGAHFLFYHFLGSLAVTFAVWNLVHCFLADHQMMTDLSLLLPLLCSNVRCCCANEDEGGALKLLWWFLPSFTLSLTLLTH